MIYEYPWPWLVLASDILINDPSPATHYNRGHTHMSLCYRLPARVVTHLTCFLFFLNEKTIIF